jgi:hypothetical protein
MQHALWSCTTLDNTGVTRSGTHRYRHRLQHLPRPHRRPRLHGAMDHSCHSLRPVIYVRSSDPTNSTVNGPLPSSLAFGPVAYIRAQPVVGST